MGNRPLMARHGDLTRGRTCFTEKLQTDLPLRDQFRRVSIHHFLINSGFNLVVISNGFFMQSSEFQVRCNRSCTCNRGSK
jgi:hypothetical protein